MPRSNQILNPKAREALDRLKMETASEVGVQLKQGYNGDIKSRDAGQIGGNMVRKMIQSYENSVQSSF
jgi:small acid-soluble spore protein D (minor alpha/beta-type SASP)